MVSGAISACAISTAGVGCAFARSANSVAGRSLGGFAVTAISTPGGTAAAMARAKAVPLAAKTKSGLKNLDNGFELAEILRQQRVRHRDRRIGNADMHGGKAKERVLDIVAGKNRDRALRRQAARQQRRGDGAHFRQCVGISQRAPGARRVTLRQKHALGRGFRPMHQALGELLRECRQRMRRAQHDGAVAAALDHDVRRPEQDRPQRRLRRCLVRFCGRERHWV